MEEKSKMKFYSEITNTIYNTEEELNRAELNATQMKMKVKAKKIEEAKAKEETNKKIAMEIKHILSLIDELRECIDQFIKDHNNDKAALLSLSYAYQRIIDYFVMMINF